MKKTILLLGLALIWQVASAQQPPIPSVIKGLTIMLEYKDYKMPETVQEISDLMNKQGYNANNNLGSVRDYFYSETGGKVTITSTVVKVSFPENYEYYHSNGRNYVDDAIEILNQTNPEGFQGLTADPVDGKLLHLNFIERSPGAGSTNEASKTLYVKNNTTGQIRIGQGNIWGAPSWVPISIGTVCHEMGHSVMSWTDCYNPFCMNFGRFDLMSNAETERGPMPINAALRLQRGWIDNIIDINGAVTQTYTLTANNYSTIHRYKNPNNSKEYLLFYVYKIAGYYQSPVSGVDMPEGLAIWYVDEDRGYASPAANNYDFFIKLVQADNLDEMNNIEAPDRNGDAEDLYGNANKSFPNGNLLRWKDGGELGISISNISSPGASMSFTVNGRPNTVVASSDIYGTISPKGTLSLANGQTQTFTFTPKPGYEIDVVKENGVAVTVPNPYTMSAVSGTKTISVSFKKKSPVAALTAPWQKASINGSSSDFVGTTSNSVYLETYGNSIGGYGDNFTFAYQAINGNGTFIAHLAEFNTLPDGRAGLMLRESLDANSEFWAVSKYTYGGVIEMLRPAANQANIDNPKKIKEPYLYDKYNWFKIVKNGSYIQRSTSKDGVNWTVLGDTIYSMSSQFYIGLFTESNYSSYPSQAIFDNISFNSFPTPMVTITSPANNSVFTTGSVTINATATPVAANGSIVKVDFYHENTLIGSDNTAPYSVTWTNVPGGIQSIYAKVTDDNLSVGTSRKVYVELPCPFVNPKITGSIIGIQGQSGYTLSNVFDGDKNTILDTQSDIGWVGLNLPSGYQITGIRFFPRIWYTSRMTGGKFQASNTADFSSGVVDLYTIQSEPVYNWTCLDISNTTPFKYVRYICPSGGYTNVGEIEFFGIATNIQPTVTLTSPTSGATIETAPAIPLTANASDVDGTIARVEFFVGSTLVGTDYTAPYSSNWNSPTPGTYNITALAYDNSGSAVNYTILNVKIIAATGPIAGPTCGTNNTTLAFELNASKRANATGYNWWYTGSTQSITPVSGAPYSVTLTTGNNFGTGDVCVGINYSVSPWYASYCKTIAKCGARMGIEEIASESLLESIVYPNPTLDVFNVDLAADADVVSIVNNMGQIIFKDSDLKQGERISVGADFEPGVYSISIKYINGQKEVLRMVKVQ